MPKSDPDMTFLDAVASTSNVADQEMCGNSNVGESGAESVPRPYQIILFHDGEAFKAEVSELPCCSGRGASYAEALYMAEKAIVACVKKLAHAPLPPPLQSHIASTSVLEAFNRLISSPKRKPTTSRAFSSVKIRLTKKFGTLSNRELAACIGLVARDAPVMLSCAVSGRGTRVVRCAIAVALDQMPSALWPDRSASVRKADDVAYHALRADLLKMNGVVLPNAAL